MDAPRARGHATSTRSSQSDSFPSPTAACRLFVKGSTRASAKSKCETGVLRWGVCPQREATCEGWLGRLLG